MQLLPGLLDVRFDIIENLASFHYMQVVLAILLYLLWRKEIGVALSDDLRKRLADRIAKPLITIDEPALKVFSKHVQRQALDQRLIHRLLFTQRLLGLLVLTHQT